MNPSRTPRPAACSALQRVSQSSHPLTPKASPKGDGEAPANSPGLFKLSRRSLLAAGALACTLPGVLQANSARLARFVVGFPPGGSTDVVARLIAAHSKGFADVSVVENVPGAAGRMAIMRVKDAAADGTSVLVCPAALMTLYPHVYTNLAYAPLEDFVPVAAVGTVAFALVVSNEAVPPNVQSLEELDTWLRANPNYRHYASGGAGTPMHFVGDMLARHLGQELTHVAYRGAAPMIQDLIGGQVAMGVTVLGDSLPHVESGRLRVIAVSSAKRSPFLPDAPTFADLDAPQIVAEENFGLYLPAAAPPEIVQRLANAVQASLDADEVKVGLTKLACVPTFLGPDTFRQFLVHNLVHWEPVVRTSGFALED